MMLLNGARGGDFYCLAHWIGRGGRIGAVHLCTLGPAVGATARAMPIFLPFGIVAQSRASTGRGAAI